MQPLQRQHSRTMTNAIVRECTIQILCRRDHAVSMCAETAIDEEGLTPPMRIFANIPIVAFLCVISVYVLQTLTQ